VPFSFARRCAGFPKKCTYDFSTPMAVHEWIAAVYLGTFALAAWLFPLPHRQRLLATAVSSGVLLLIAISSSERWPTLRAWIPHAYLVAGYWVPALLVRSEHHVGFESWLVASDVLLRRTLPGIRGPLADLVELAYLLCYPLIPLVFAIVWVNASVEDVERFWTAVLLAGYACYATLPWLVSRPPRLRDHPAVPRGRLGRINAFVLGRVSHRLNTFPSGHVAVTGAAAASVASLATAPGLALFSVVAAICVGAAAGRYHYVIDVLLGLVVAVAAAGVAQFV